MSDWQPAYIADFDPCHPGINSDEWPSGLGKNTLLRVRIVEGKKEPYGCGGRVLQLHPDDTPAINCPPDCKDTCYLCEHMVVTD